ncbi:MAG: TRAFs-binding domain-containing protein [Bacteroidota bacterium]
MAIKSYKEGFDADWRDAYPGVNLVTLLELKGDRDLLEQYLPVVQFANKRKIERTGPDYWDLATEGELAVLDRNYETATQHFSEAIALIPDNESWMLETSVNNLKIIQSARTEHGTQDDGLASLIAQFEEYL